MVNAFLITSDDIIIADPEGEYFPLVSRLGGQVVKLSPTSPHYLNPMDINSEYDDEDPLTLKSDFILSLCELIVGGKEGLSPTEKTIIDRCVRLVYRDYLQDPRPENMPILEDLYNLLRKQTEKEAQHVATALEIYVTGSLRVFNHRTNVNMSNRLVCFDIKELGKQLKKLGMLILQDAVWNRVTINRAAKKTTHFYIDEFHLLLKEEQTAAYSIEIWKRFRKWGGIPTGITQNVKDLLSSREIENIFENLYCKGDMSNILLKHSDSRIIRSTIKAKPSNEGRLPKRYSPICAWALPAHVHIENRQGSQTALLHYNKSTHRTKGGFYEP
jgi:type IV secretory pathway VirB4 component